MYIWLTVALMFGPFYVLSFYKQIHTVSKRTNHQELMTICPTGHTMTTSGPLPLLPFKKFPMVLTMSNKKLKGKKHSHLIYLAEFNPQIIWRRERTNSKSIVWSHSSRFAHWGVIFNNWLPAKPSSPKKLLHIMS